MDRDRLLRSLATRVRDERVLAAMAAVPRELFVTPSMTAAAYEDTPLRIGLGQTISQPTIVARMCELLELRPTDRVLDVGTGSGYHAAILAQLCDHVWGVELEEQLALRAARALGRAGIDNVTVVPGDGALGLPEQAPYDAINVAATARGEVPPALEQQLALGGRLVAPVSDGDSEQLVRVVRRECGFERERLEPVRFVPLR
ncbi:MAG TPA: protein-L-isoaspartate(D-aspartate) O-methyltransferase [Solirubrobacteraceae bacterium]|jgi:protein-L-isoaspartate(D-aspartate) O-methyltransferase|nr:protein-L-isoaspartate(D-aspartate) O-methyltransferase [Solirubrobacteraceae bacterium]